MTTLLLFLGIFILSALVSLLACRIIAKVDDKLSRLTEGPDMRRSK